MVQMGLLVAILKKKSFQSSFIFQAFQPYYYNEDIICLTPNGCISGIQKLIYEEYLTSRSDTVAPLSGPAAFGENFNIKPEEQTQGSECKLLFFCLFNQPTNQIPKKLSYGLSLFRSCLLNEEFFFQCQINFSPFTFSTTAIYSKQVWRRIFLILLLVYVMSKINPAHFLQNLFKNVVLNINRYVKIRLLSNM